MLRRIGVLTALVAAALLVLAPVGSGSSVTRRCQASDFKLTRGPTESALAHYRQTVRLHNVAQSSCTMSGWFKVRLLNRHRAVLPSQEQRITSDMFGTSPKPTVVVKPGGGASFAIDTTAPVTSCPHSRWVAITTPGGHGSRRLRLSVLACSQFSVLPVQPDNHAVHP